jgi:hypothetical protein
MSRQLEAAGVGPLSRGVVNVHPLTNYSFGHAPARAAKGASVAERMARMEERYAAEGARRTVEGIILVNEHNHPHVLLLQARRWRLCTLRRRVWPSQRERCADARARCAG